MKKSDGIDIGKILSLLFKNPIIWLVNIIVWAVVCIAFTGKAFEMSFIPGLLLFLFLYGTLAAIIGAPLLFINVNLDGKYMIYGKKTREKRDKIRILEEKCQELGSLINEESIKYGWPSKMESSLFDLQRYFNYVINDIKENKEPSYYYIDELFFAKLKSFTKLKSTVKSMSNETQSKYEKIKEMLINDAKEYYNNMKEKQNSYEYSESEYLVDAVYNVFKESEEIKSVLKL